MRLVEENEEKEKWRENNIFPFPLYPMYHATKQALLVKYDDT